MCAQAKRDDNRIPTLLAVSNADGTTPVVLWADPTTHRLLVSTTSAGSATTALDNLASVAINTSLISDTDITDDLGTGDIRWNNTYTQTVRAGLTATDVLKLEARDVDGSSWTTFLTLTSANVPTATMSGITVDADLTPTSTDGAALGTSALNWSDLFLDSGAVINFDSGDVTITHSLNTLTLAGGILSQDDATESTSGTTGSIHTDGGLGVAKDIFAGIDVTAGGQVFAANGTASNPSFAFTADANTGWYTTGNNDEILISLGGALNYIMDTTAFKPGADDGNALGSTAVRWSDLFLAEGGVINWDNGDFTLTQAGNLLTVAGGDLNIADQLDVEGYMAIGNGAALSDTITLRINRTFTASAGQGYGLLVDGAITAAANQQVQQALFAGSITTPATSTNANVHTVEIREPNITKGDTIDVASSLWISGAPTEGTANYALFVGAGATKLSGTLEVDGITTINDQIILTDSAAFGTGDSGIRFDNGAPFSIVIQSIHSMTYVIDSDSSSTTTSFKWYTDGAEENGTQVMTLDDEGLLSPIDVSITTARTTTDAFTLNGDTLTTGNLMNLTASISGSGLANRSSGNNYVDIFSSRTDSRTTGTTADDFDVVSIRRTSVTTGAGGTLTAAGSVLKIENISTQTAGTLTDTVDVLELVQDADSTGAALKVSGGVIQLDENTSLQLDPAGSADGKYSGITITGTGGATIAFGDLIYLQASDSRWELVDADAVGTAGTVQIGMAVTTSSDGAALTILLSGQIRADANFPALTIGASVYASTTPGNIQVAAPSGSADVVRVVGFALTADEIYFNPSPDHIVVA